MDTDKKRAILTRVDALLDYANKPGNEWLLLEFQQKVSDEQIRSIYEHCIEKNLKEQAHGFYSQFGLKDIIPQLEYDFIQMERARRNNEFDEFTMAVYQQIECITNNLCSNTKLTTAVERLMGHPAYISYNSKANEQKKEPTLSDRYGNYQIATLLFGKGEDALKKSKSNLQAQWATDKIVCLLYFVCYQAKLYNTDFQTFIDYKQSLIDIYQIRCKNHRGSVIKDYQKEIYDRVYSQKSLYVMKFMDVLYFFVTKINDGLPHIDKLYNYAIKETPKDVKVGPNVLYNIDLNKIPRK